MKYGKLILLSIVAIYLSINSLVWHTVGTSALQSAPESLLHLQQHSFLYVLFANGYAQMLQWLNFSILIPFGVFAYYIILRDSLEISSLKEEVRRLKSGQQDEVPPLPAGQQ